MSDVAMVVAEVRVGWNLMWMFMYVNCIVYIQPGASPLISS